MWFFGWHVWRWLMLIKLINTDTEPGERIELSASFLPRKRSTSELPRHNFLNLNSKRAQNQEQRQTTEVRPRLSAWIKRTGFPLARSRLTVLVLALAGQFPGRSWQPQARLWRLKVSTPLTSRRRQRPHNWRSMTWCALHFFLLRPGLVLQEHRAGLNKPFFPPSL